MFPAKSSGENGANALIMPERPAERQTARIGGETAPQNEKEKNWMPGTIEIIAAVDRESGVRVAWRL